MLFLEHMAELGERAAQARRHRADGDAKHAGDVLDGEVEPVAEHDDEALLRVERGHGLNDRAEVLTRLERSRLPGDVVIERRQPLAAAK